MTDQHSTSSNPVELAEELERINWAVEKVSEWINWSGPRPEAPASSIGVLLHAYLALRLTPDNGGVKGDASDTEDDEGWGPTFTSVTRGLMDSDRKAELNRKLCRMWPSNAETRAALIDMAAHINALEKPPNPVPVPSLVEVKTEALTQAEAALAVLLGSDPVSLPQLEQCDAALNLVRAALQIGAPK